MEKAGVDGDMYCILKCCFSYYFKLKGPDKGKGEACLVIFLLIMLEAQQNLAFSKCKTEVTCV